MNQELLKEVNESSLLKFYTSLVNLYSKHRNWYAVVLIAAFLLGAPFSFLEVDKDIVKIISYVIITAWAPGILFLLTMAPVHFLTGIKLRVWAKKYKINYNKEFLNFIYENQKK